MATKTKRNFKILNIVTWVIFIGICIKTGTLIFTLFFSLFINPIATQDLHLGLNLSGLMEYDLWIYIAMVVLIIIIWALKAFLFYWIIKIFQKAKYTHPFTTEVAGLISKVAYVALGIGMVSILTTEFEEWLINRGVELINLYEYTSGGVEFLFTAAIVFAIAQVFKRGIEIQSENELTI